MATAKDRLLRGPRVREGLAWFDANEENLGAAVRNAADLPDLREVGVRLVRAGLWAWLSRERFEELQVGIATFATLTGQLDSEPAVVVDGLGLLVHAFTSTRSDVSVPSDTEPRVPGSAPGSGSLTRRRVAADATAPRQPPAAGPPGPCRSR